MRNIISSLAIVTCLIVTGPASHAQEPSTLTIMATAALQRLDAVALDDEWYFTMTMHLSEERETLVIGNDPGRDALHRRQLLSVNGAPPEPRRLKAFRKEEIKRIEERDEVSARYSYIVDTTTLTLTSLDKDTASFRFCPPIGSTGR